MTDRKFRKLVNLYLDKEITAKDLESLKLEIAKDPLRKFEFQRSCRIHAAERKILLEKARRQRRKNTTASASENRQRKQALISYARTGSPVRMDLILEKERKQTRFGRIFNLTAAVAMVGIVIGGALTWLNYEEQFLDNLPPFHYFSQKDTSPDIEAWQKGRVSTSADWRFLMPVMSEDGVRLVSLTPQELNDWVSQPENADFAEQLRAIFPEEMVAGMDALAKGWGKLPASESLAASAEVSREPQASFDAFMPADRKMVRPRGDFHGGYYITPAGLASF